MLRAAFIAAFLLRLSDPSDAQFTEIPSGTTSNINSIGHSEGQIFFLGENYLSKTSDLGNSLTSLNIPTSQPNKLALNVVDTSILYLISGHYNTSAANKIIKTTDGGASWSTVLDTTGISINDFTVSENGNLLAVGSFGDVWRSTNGNNWLFSNANNIASIEKCVSISDSTYIIGGIGEAGRSEDLGDTWETRSFQYSYPSSIIPISQDTIYMSSSFKGLDEWGAFFSISTDGGINWTSDSIGIHIAVNDMEFENENHGYAVGYNYVDSLGIVMETLDGGATWEKHLTDYGSRLNDVELIEDSLLFIVGDDGLILKIDPFTLKTKTEHPEDFKKAKVFPNPANINSEISVRVDNKGKHKLDIISAKGEYLKERHFTNSTKIQVNEPGIYIFKISKGPNSYTSRKVLIQSGTKD